MRLVDKPIIMDEIKTMAENGFGQLVKAVVDVRKKIMVLDVELHADAEAMLLSQGSRGSDLWGINLYPKLPAEEFIEFDSMINVRPSCGNFSRGVDNPALRLKIKKIVDKLIKK